MSSSINNSTFTDQLEQMLKSFVQEKLELIMREELENFLNVENPDVPKIKMVIINAHWILDTEKLKNYPFLELVKVSFKPDCLLRISVYTTNWIE